MKVSKWLWIVVLVGIGIRFALFLCQKNPAGDDGLRYLTEALNLVDHGVFSTSSNLTPPPPSAHDMPLYPAIMATFYWLTGSVAWTQILAGILNLLLVCGSVFFLCSMLRQKPFGFSDKAIALATFVFLFMPESFVYSLFHMPDQTALFFVVLMLWCYFRGCCCSPKYHVGTFLAAIGAIYSKPICIPLCFALIFAMPLLQRGCWWKRGLVVGVGLLIVGSSMIPWVMRNKVAFGTSGLTSISGTNLYGCNWGWYVNSLPEAEQSQLKSEMADFQDEIKDYDLMKRSKLQGKFAKEKILENLGGYLLFTMKKHPRLYAGTGTIALFRYLGRDDICFALNDSMKLAVPENEKTTYTQHAAFFGKITQGVMLLLLFGCYVLVGIGVVKGSFRQMPFVAWLCPILCLLLLALVIGPVTATRYRFIMNPFFALLTAYAVKDRS